MPNRRITIILNANQSKRITVLVPLPDGPDEPYNVRDHILTQARNKFRVKELNIVYRWGGVVVYDGDTLPDKIEEVLVSKGEAYIGPPEKHTRTDGKAGEVSVLASQSFVHEDAIKQLEAITALEGVHSAIGMPDLHKGDRFPIGCAIVAEGIYPALIGSDIGCGIALYPLGRIPSHLTPEKLASRLYNRNLDGPWDGSPRDWLARYGVTRHTEFDESLGTVGAGNHFAEICKIERIVDSEACESIGLREGEMYLLVHTGSRGLGSSILRSFTKSDANPYFRSTSAEFQTYLEHHDHAVKWAQANRDLVAHRIKYCLFEKEPNPLHAEEGEDTDTPTIVEADESKAGEDEPNVDPCEALEKLLDVTHNAVVRQGWIVNGQSQEVWIHRKGAAPSDQGFVPCPGSRGDFSWILQPSGDGQINAHSLPHGAGRLHPRNAHILRPRPHPGYPAPDLTTTTLNSHVICTDPQLLIEERPEAYKSIQAVVDDVEEKRIAEGVCVLRPFVTYKAGDPTGSGLSAREREREKAARTTGLGSGPIGKSMAESPDDEA